jgi:hypothetical protein
MGGNQYNLRRGDYLGFYPKKQGIEKIQSDFLHNFQLN